MSDTIKIGTGELHSEEVLRVPPADGDKQSSVIAGPMQLSANAEALLRIMVGLHSEQVDVYGDEDRNFGR